MIQLAREGKRANYDMKIMVGQPQDPNDYKADDEAVHGGHGYPSFLCWEETQKMIEECELHSVHVDEGRLGHPTKKPTTVLTDVEEIMGVDAWKMKEASAEWPEARWRIDWPTLRLWQHGPQVLRDFWSMRSSGLQRQRQQRHRP